MSISLFFFTLIVALSPSCNLQDSGLDVLDVQSIVSTVFIVLPAIIYDYHRVTGMSQRRSFNPFTLVQV